MSMSKPLFKLLTLMCVMLAAMVASPGCEEPTDPSLEPPDVETPASAPSPTTAPTAIASAAANPGAGAARTPAELRKAAEAGDVPSMLLLGRSQRAVPKGSGRTTRFPAGGTCVSRAAGSTGSNSGESSWTALITRSSSRSLRTVSRSDRLVSNSVDLCTAAVSPAALEADSGSTSPVRPLSLSLAPPPQPAAITHTSASAALRMPLLMMTSISIMMVMR